MNLAWIRKVSLWSNNTVDGKTPHVVPPKDTNDHEHFHVEGLSDEASDALVRHITEIAATTTALATRDVTRAPHKAARMVSTPSKSDRPHHHRTVTTATEGAAEEHDAGAGHSGGGHDAPNWSRGKSAAILLTATVAYAIIAEILVDTVDSVLEGSDIDEKFLGITLFALVPNTTEFLNAISFAMNGNIALSMEIGSAYALQVCLLQIPALVFYSALHATNIDAGQLAKETFSKPLTNLQCGTMTNTSKHSSSRSGTWRLSSFASSFSRTCMAKARATTSRDPF
jgi:Ca2+:H+ antiporter